MNVKDLNFKNLWKPILVALAVVFLYATVLTKLVGHWWTDENYSHGLLVPFIISYIIWFKFDNLKKAPKTPQFWIGDGGTILHTTTAGNVWVQADTKSKYKFEKIVFNGKKGWIVGFGGTILSYEAGNQALAERPKLRIR